MENIREMLKKVAAGELSVDNAVLELKKEPFTAAGYDDLGFAKLDTHRKLRQGAAEVIYGAGKTPGQIAGIVEAMKKRKQETILITRVDEEKSRETERLLAELYPTGSGYQYFKEAKVAICGSFPEKDGVGTIVVATGGTSDIPVAEEAALTAEALGNQVERLYDVGVAGLHRLISHMDSIMNARVIIAIAGTEGALASVIGGLAGDRGADQHRIRSVLRRRVSTALHAEFLRQRCQRCEYRQWIWSRVSGEYDEPYAWIKTRKSVRSVVHLEEDASSG